MVVVAPCAVAGPHQSSCHQRLFLWRCVLSTRRPNSASVWWNRDHSTCACVANDTHKTHWLMRKLWVAGSCC